VQEIFESALPHDAATRQHILDRDCGDDADLKAEVHSLLAADSGVRRQPP
jgi:hypothetical protein